MSLACLKFLFSLLISVVGHSVRDVRPLLPLFNECVPFTPVLCGIGALNHPGGLLFYPLPPRCYRHNPGRPFIFLWAVFSSRPKWLVRCFSCTLMIFFFLIHLQGRVTKGQREWKLLHLVVQFPNGQFSQTKSRSQESHLGFPREWQNPKRMGRRLLLSQAH